MKFSPQAEDLRLQRLNLDLRKPLLRAMQMHSKRLSGCKRRSKGSQSHFARQAILWFMRDKFDCDFSKINPEIYKISKMGVDKRC
jgi:hypothetical protein